jgi:hypothetical protein
MIGHSLKFGKSFVKFRLRKSITAVCIKAAINQCGYFIVALVSQVRKGWVIVNERCPCETNAIKIKDDVN